MVTIREMLKHGTAGAVLAVALIAGSASAPAQNVDLEQQILKSLIPAAKPTAARPPTRSLTTAPVDNARPDDNKFLESLKNRSSRSLTLNEREQIAAIAKDRPSVDVEINFDFRSANIGRAAVPSVAALGRALTSPELKGSTFVLAGHTDAKGSDRSNQDLSEKRADSVKRYLVQHFQIPPATLVTAGYGKTKLKNESDPLGGENRRVQIVNMEERAISER
jgi:outer membrane protein OmpA-like peptidoglycan-associated protein